MALEIANILLAAAVLAGIVLVGLHMRATAPAQRPPLWAGVSHGIAGTLGLLALLIALQGPPRAVAAGGENFGRVAAVLFGLTLLAGLLVLARRRHSPAISLVIHAGLAICAYVLFLAWSSL
jgi:hypothetical protein